MTINTTIKSNSLINNDENSSIILLINHTEKTNALNTQFVPQNGIEISLMHLNACNEFYRSNSKVKFLSSLFYTAYISHRHFLKVAQNCMVWVGRFRYTAKITTLPQELTLSDIDSLCDYHLKVHNFKIHYLFSYEC